MSFTDPMGLDERPENPKLGDSYEDDNGNNWSFLKGTSGNRWTQGVTVTADRSASYNGTVEDLAGRNFGVTWSEGGFQRALGWNQDVNRLAVSTLNGSNWQEDIPETDAERSNRRLTLANQAADMGQLALPVIGGAVFTAAAIPAVVPLIGRATLTAAGTGGGAAAGNPQARQQIMSGIQGLWNMNPFTRGGVIERLLGQNLPRNFPTIDKFDWNTGAATSIKSLDVNALTYQNINTLSRTLTSYINSVAQFGGRTWANVTVGGPQNPITSRSLELAIPLGATPAQMQVIQNAVQYGNNIGVSVITKVIQ